MLTYTDIQRLASEGEGKSIEFKETTGQLDRGMETLCAFFKWQWWNITFWHNRQWKDYWTGHQRQNTKRHR